MPPDLEPKLGPRKLSVLVLSGTYERVHYALVLASGAAAIGTPATLFFTGPALLALRGSQDIGRAGWRSLASAEGAQGGEVDDGYRERGVAGFEELLSACVELGVRFIVCEMGLRVMRLDPTALRPDVPVEVAGVVSFLSDAQPGGMLTL